MARRTGTEKCTKSAPGTRLKGFLKLYITYVDKNHTIASHSDRFSPNLAHTQLPFVVNKFDSTWNPKILSPF